MLDRLEDLAERIMFDPSFVDLMLWLPHLSWGEIAASAATIVAWRLACDPVEDALVLHMRRATATALEMAARAIRP